MQACRRTITFDGCLFGTFVPLMPSHELVDTPWVNIQGSRMLKLQEFMTNAE